MIPTKIDLPATFENSVDLRLGLSFSSLLRVRPRHAERLRPRQFPDFFVICLDLPHLVVSYRMVPCWHDIIGSKSGKQMFLTWKDNSTQKERIRDLNSSSQGREMVSSDVTRTFFETLSPI